MKIYSFDIFDTCFLRSCGSPEGIFELLAIDVIGNKAEEAIYQDFVNIRVQGEIKARANTIEEEITIDDIYNYCDFAHLTTWSKIDILKREIEIEKEQLIAVYSIRTKIEQLHVTGNNILYISDMYLPEFMIKKLLISHGFWNEGDKLYLSSSYKLTKSSGHLYDFIAKEQNASFKNWYHYGDNPQSDYIIPHKKGIKAKLINHKMSIYENMMSQYSISPTFPFLNVFASISKAIRLTELPNIKIDFAADFIAPLYTTFVFDILQDATKKGIKRLYFLARDSYLPYQIALELKQMFPEIEVCYLYVSRKSLYLPGLEILNDKKIIELFGEWENKTLKELLDSIGINCEQLPISIPQDVLCGETGFKVLHDFIALPQIRSIIQNWHKYQHEMCLSYFEQERIASLSDKNAIVDIRGTRKCQRSINNILKRANYLPVFAYYLEVAEQRCSIEETGEYHATLFTEKYLKNRSLKPIYAAYGILEQYFSLTDTKRTAGYERNKTGITVPIFDERAENTAAHETMLIHTNISQKYVRYYIRNKLYLYNKNLLYNSIHILGCFLSNPDYHFLQALKGIQIAENRYNIRPVFRKIRMDDLFSLIKNRYSFKKRFYWTRGSLIYTTGPWGNILLKWYLGKNK